MKYLRKVLRILRTLWSLAIRDLFRPRWSVTIMLHDQSYGGAEEGGWWYGTHERIDDDPSNREFWFEWTARRWYEHVRSTVIPLYNEGRREITSVVSDGRYEVWIDNAKPAEFYPQHRPRYE